MGLGYIRKFPLPDYQDAAQNESRAGKIVEIKVTFPWREHVGSQCLQNNPWGKNHGAHHEHTRMETPSTWA